MGSKKSQLFTANEQAGYRSRLAMLFDFFDYFVTATFLPHTFFVKIFL